MTAWAFTMAIYKRAWRLRLQVEDSVKTYQELNYQNSSLKIDFEVVNNVYGAFSNASITISGLNQDDLQYLASSTNPYGKFKRNRVSLEAGYVGEVGLIISGNIIETDVDFTSPDKAVTLKIMGGVQNNLLNNSVQSSLSGVVDFRRICDECAAKNNLKLRYDNKISKRNLTDFSFLGTPYQFIERIREYFEDLNIFINETDNTLNVLLKQGGEIINEQTLSNLTGLVGRPKPTMLGVNVRSLLNINLRVGEFIKLQNEELKAFDGVYRINELKHRGGNLSPEWVTDLSLYKRV